jgi:fucose 4-O-acetylase-like acetyltransferase
MPLSPFTSQKFRFYSFLSMLLLVFVHGYNLHDSYLQPSSIVQEPLTITTYTEYFLANGLFRFRIPMLFIISGYLFAMNDTKPYGERMKKRLRTLGIPYLFWSAFALLLTFLWQQFPVTAQAVKDSMLDQMGDNRPYTEIGIGGIVMRWLLVPIAFQLWFIRNLLIYNAAYPVLVKAVTRAPKIWFPIVGLMWLSGFGVFFIEGEGLLFFTLGIFLQKINFDITQSPKWLSAKIWAPVFLISAAVKSYLAFQFDWGLQSFIILTLLHKLCVFSGLVTMWYGCDWLVKWFMNRKWFVWVSAFAFIIYAVHVPLVNYSTQLVFRYFGDVPNYRFLSFVFLSLTIVLISILFGAILRKLFPAFYGFITGGRGLQ